MKQVANCRSKIQDHWGKLNHKKEFFPSPKQKQPLQLQVMLLIQRLEVQNNNGAEKDIWSLQSAT